MRQDKFTRRNRTAEEMFPLVEAYQSSSASRAAFCASHNLPISALNYWQSKYRKAHGAESAIVHGGFVELSPAVSAGGEVLMELGLGGGQTLRFYAYPSAAYLGQLMSVKGC